MALSTILRLLMAAGKTKKAAKVGKAMLSGKGKAKSPYLAGKDIPIKSKGMPGVTRRAADPIKGKWEGVSATRYRPSREDVAMYRKMGESNRVLEEARKRLMEAPRRATRAQSSRVPREATRLSPEVMRMIEKFRKGGSKRRGGRLTKDQELDMRDAAIRDRINQRINERGMREELRRYGTPMQQDLGEYNRALYKEFAPQLRGKKKPTVWDQMRAMADEFDDYPID